jgi:amino acid adenylation domain-containing protein
VLGIWRSGRAVLPLDPAQPPDRMATILAEADVALVIAEHATADLVAGEGRTVALREDLSGRAERTRSRPSPDEPAYVIFTSGTTGRPKGVTITHASLLNALVGWEAAYDLEPADVHLQMAAPGFDVWMGDLVRAIATGGTLVVLPREWLLVPERIAEVVGDEGVTVAEFVPSVLRTLRDHLARTGDRLSHMRLIACGSDQWYVREIAGILDVIPGDCRLVNSYGLTEATIDSSFFELATLTGDPDRQIPIGRPFANVRMHVLDARLRPVPIGVLGELCIGGAGIARGYLKRPDLDAERFVADPFCADPGARLYRTGDVARMRADGVFELVGRSDDQVKIRGNRVELGDIEACLASHPSVAAAVATFERGADDSGGRLGAFVVPRPGEPVDHAGLLELARAVLPGYMVPGTIRTIACVPIGVNGKVDRKALPALGEDLGDEALDRTAPRTETERALLDIWRSLLEIEAQFGVHADFFQLGGHSLLATRLMWLVRDQLDAAVPPHAIFEDSTIARLAVRVDAARLASGMAGRSTAGTETTEF